MKRTIIKIDESLCNGCGACVKGCHEGALQLINGKAIIVSELYCDGLGACIGDCPVDAITLEEREAEAYNETAVMERLVPKGEKVILAHLNHLKEHGKKKLYQEGINYLKSHGLPVPSLTPTLGCGCPGTHQQEIKRPKQPSTGFAPISMTNNRNTSELRQFPVQLHLLNPYAPFLQNTSLLVAADCTAFAYGDFHQQFLKNHTLAIACPKLDNGIDNYIQKLTTLIDEAGVQSIHVVVMEVPCCRGLVRIVEEAMAQANRQIPVSVSVISVQGDIKSQISL